MEVKKRSYFRRRAWKGQGMLVGKEQESICPCELHKKNQVEIKNVIKPSWAAGAGSSVQAGGDEDRALEE